MSHDQTEALVLADRIAVLRDGQIEQLGTADEIWRTPATTFVARFVGSPGMNLLPAGGPLRPAGGPLRPPGGPLRPAGGPSHAEVGEGHVLGFRPEAAVLGHPHGEEALVERVEVVGADAYAYLLLGEHTIVARVPARSRPASGEKIRVGVGRSDVHLFDADTGRRVRVL